MSERAIGVFFKVGLPYRPGLPGHVLFFDQEMGVRPDFANKVICPAFRKLMLNFSMPPKISKISNFWKYFSWLKSSLFTLLLLWFTYLLLFNILMVSFLRGRSSHVKRLSSTCCLQLQWHYSISSHWVARNQNVKMKLKKNC